MSVVAAFVVYQRTAGRKRHFLCLLPVAAGALCKPTAVMFAPLFLAYLLLVEGEPLRRAARRSIPAFVGCAGLYLLVAWMTPPTWEAGGSSRLLYMATQPAVIAHYVRSFFLPLWLSADADWEVVPSLGDIRVFLGLVFLAGLARIIWVTRETPPTRPIAFGLVWFLLALVPTSVVPLAEVTNDHRMFFPFVGMALSVVWAAHLGARRLRLPGTAIMVAWAVILPLCAYGVHERNTVWRDGETLWADVCAKSPNNGRGLMNYGLVFMARGEYNRARELFTQALERLPSYPSLRVNLGILEAARGNPEQAEDHFRAALALAPRLPVTHTFFGRFLMSRGRFAEAVPLLERSVALAPAEPQARRLLLQTFAALGSPTEYLALAQETLALAPHDPEFRGFAGGPDQGIPDAVRREAVGGPARTFLAESLVRYREGRFEACILAAETALQLDPGLAEAHNNLSAAHNALGRFEQGLEAGRAALALRQDFPLARNNVEWSLRGIALRSAATR